MQRPCLASPAKLAHLTHCSRRTSSATRRSGSLGSGGNLLAGGHPRGESPRQVTDSGPAARQHHARGDRGATTSLTVDDYLPVPGNFIEPGLELREREKR